MPQPGHARRLRQSGQFVLDKNAYFYRRGLRFAHLNARWGIDGANFCYDSGPMRAKGTQSGTLNWSSWDWSELIFRPQTYFIDGAAKITYDCNPVIGTGPWSISAWCYPIGGGGWDGPIVGWGDTSTSHAFVELNVDTDGYLHCDQASGSNSATFVGALTPDAWNHVLYTHRDNSPVNGDSLWVNGVAAAGGGVGSTPLNIQPGGGDTLIIGESNQSSLFQINAALGDVLIFDQKLGEQDAIWLADATDPGLRGLITDGLITNAYDLEHVR